MIVNCQRINKILGVGWCPSHHIHSWDVTRTIPLINTPWPFCLAPPLFLISLLFDFIPSLASFQPPLFLIFSLFFFPLLPLSLSYSCSPFSHFFWHNWETKMNLIYCIFWKLLSLSSCRNIRKVQMKEKDCNPLTQR